MDCRPPGCSVHEDSPGKKTGVGCHFLLQGIFPTQGLNPGLLHCRQILHHWATSGGQLLIAPERMKQLGQSRNDTQLWMCLVVRVKSDESYHEYVLIYFESDPLSSPSLPNPEHHQQSLGSCSSPCFWHPLPFILPMAWAQRLTRGILDKHSTMLLFWQPRASTREPDTILSAVTTECM